MGGAIEESAKGENSIIAVMPMMLIAVLTLLMIQLQSFSKTIMVLLTSPLGLIGVAFILLTWNVPFGFVANLGVIALFGMIMRNSVILVDQIEQDITRRPFAVGSDHRGHGAALPADRADRACRSAGDDPAVAFEFLGADGGRDHGRPDIRHRSHAAVRARALCGLVPRQETLNPGDNVVLPPVCGPDQARGCACRC